MAALKNVTDTAASNVSVAASQKLVVKNAYICLIALISASMYISRYAIESWGIFYAQAQKGYSNVTAVQIIGMTAVTGIIGTAISGFISYKFFTATAIFLLLWPGC